MNQGTHTWIAVRAVGLLAKDPSTRAFAALIAPHVCEAAIGAWLPDLGDARAGSSAIDNHVFKMAPFKGRIEHQRFVTRKKALLKNLGRARSMTRFLKEDQSLDSKWWAAAYRADPGPWRHVVSRATALSTAIADLLILGDKPVQQHVPGSKPLANRLTKDERTREAQVALYCFMLSHFVADTCMPCHCDARALAAYKSGGLHAGWEGYLLKKIGRDFEEKNLARHKDPSELIALAASVDGKLGIAFNARIPKLVNADVWKEMVQVARGSFSVDCIVAPPGAKARKFTQVRDTSEVIERASQVVLRDAVLNVAMVWKHIWGKVRGAKGKEGGCRGGGSCPLPTGRLAA